MKIIGHQKQWQFLKNCLKFNRISHAYLFSGPEFLGKKTLALEFVKLINCQNKKERGCGQCYSCKMISNGNYPDLKIISPDSSESSFSIHISQIRELQRFLSLKSYYSFQKTVIIDQAEKMTPEAQSSLLKTLEETKGKALLILISAFPDLLFPTIISRCQVVKFLPLSDKEIKNYLLTQGISSQKIEWLVKISQGRPAIAINFLLNPKKLEEEEKILKGILKLSKYDLATRFNYLKELSLSKKRLKEILDLLERHFRQTLFSEKLNPSCLSKTINNIKLIEKLNFLNSSTNLNPKLTLEILMINL